MPSLAPYESHAAQAVDAFLESPPGLHLYLRSRLPERSDGHAFVYSDSGVVKGFAWFGQGRNLVFAGDDESFLDRLAELARELESGWAMVVGPFAEASRFLDLYRRRGGRRARLDRTQVFYEQTPESLPDLGEPLLTVATEDDLPELAAAASRMSAEDFEIDLFQIDRAAVRKTMEEKIRDRRSYLLRQEGRLVFKADLAFQHPAGGQVEGVYTPEAHRGRGIASRCVAEIGHRVLSELPLLSLHVAKQNVAARRAYEKAGYRPLGELRLAIFPARRRST